ncbi:hypothetical protein PPSIR1_37434 [Plesiocystis pacifica SIR-1]|uniref:Uncharacterized protein n=1 Tax=Plesiocystis pacifica SIR-1 TaxID=391625 RepID=A6GB12_9BACT|nr:hypothetical protein PPSIR1_37434 [Plesiocystis pacifica SIR-1]
MRWGVAVPVLHAVGVAEPVLRAAGVAVPVLRAAGFADHCCMLPGLESRLVFPMRCYREALDSVRPDDESCSLRCARFIHLTLASLAAAPVMGRRVEMFWRG